MFCWAASNVDEDLIGGTDEIVGASVTRSGRVIASTLQM